MVNLVYQFHMGEQLESRGTPIPLQCIAAYAHRVFMSWQVWQTSLLSQLTTLGRQHTWESSEDLAWCAFAQRFATLVLYLRGDYMIVC